VGSFVDTTRILRELDIGGRALSKPAVAWIERFLAIDRLETICTGARVTRARTDVVRQIRDVFARAGIEYSIREATDAVPAESTGPLIFFCNHPYGIADALIALEYALAKRPDTKVLANNILGALDLNADRIIWIDPSTHPSNDAANRRALRDAIKHLCGGGALLMFPSGVCSHLHPLQARITDPLWSTHLARLITVAKAASVPIYFDGSNSWRFQALGLIHPFLRTLMLVREFVGLRGRCVRAVVGSSVPCAELTNIEGVEALTLFLRNAVYSLAKGRDAASA
jgi:putative hemolysin